jgi:hypothetical protein
MKEINNYMKELLADLWYELGNFVDSVKWRVSDYVQEIKLGKEADSFEIEDIELPVEKPKKSKRGRPKKK